MFFFLQTIVMLHGLLLKYRSCNGSWIYNYISAYHHKSCEFRSSSGEVYLIQYYVIKFVSDLRQVCSFLRVLWFPPPIKLTATI